MSQRRERRTYTQEFKQQMVDLLNSGKPRADIIREKEFDNKLIDTTLKTFAIKRSLSKKGCPYDNAVAESTYKSFKAEFVYPNTFDTLNQLKLQLFDYVNRIR
ncbi:hypothetical protein OMQ_00416 [Enterococcus saccharolyticus subsp. saccharolyticus ATCC 43076]|uniref:Integrase catalytic domain-containing protein n=1 Tax=Enterococcus saccharolyticus subsp. saccharolyticus ATCC 43076 TaxID=1139996 RepID=S0JEL9_9ENTE|nr:hypothetical protein OMQ_00416 [Enterococcus saccharolyticus subsp. saccharolyticus ATCC 43076]EOT80273.1 hypothetical protein I572_00798 [Enterococcus saccharolyticus subsp. saccharolyticus ATCC 43076]